jgi:hypothetical protein
MGRARRGRVNYPISCTSYADFVRNFSEDYAHSELARSVKLFFLNGGTQCYIVRVANNPVASEVTLRDINNNPVLRFIAKSAGNDGDNIRINVTYSGTQPEATFNVELFRLIPDSNGQLIKSEQESWTGLSMDPLHPRFAPTYLSQQSSLVDVQAAAAPAPAATGFSQSGHPLSNAVLANFSAALTTLFARGTQFRISVNGGAFVNVDLSAVNLGLGAINLIVSDIEAAINANLPATSQVVVTLEPYFLNPAAMGVLRIASTTGDVFIEPSPTSDLARPLMLGTAQGGLEVTRFSGSRPVPNATVFNSTMANLITLGDTTSATIDTITIGTNPPVSLTGPNSINVGAGLIYQDGATPIPSVTDNNDGIREKIAIIATAINNTRANNPAFRWSAQVWGQRLALIPADGGENSATAVVTGLGGGGGTNIGGLFTNNVRYYSLGISGTGSFQVGGIAGSNGGVPTLADYTNTFPVIDREVDLFNIMLLPTDDEHLPAVRASLWGPASAFCQERRAFLLMDAPASWTDAQAAINPATGVNSLRIGLVKDHSAIFFPRITISENGLNVNVGPSGAIAGLMARIDGSRGVWKAPAGTEADIRGIIGIERRFSDRENGQLNPHAVNTIRIFPNGIVNWGARTMDGDDDFASEYKYIPIRRTALFIEESLYRGLKWVVFEPNDEPLWAQIRLNVGAFMHTLFRQGAFQGKTKQDAYFVKCDAETTTQNDRNLGIVNIWVGFAPLKPAEFVVLYLQQIAGQIQV